MNDKLQKKYREAEEQHAEEIFDAKVEGYREEEKMRAMFILGGINVADRVAESLSAEALKAMMKFQEERLYLSLGYDTFVDFLNKSEFSRMTKQQFYDRKALLEKEGERVFDLLTELGMSIRKRKLLGQGNVEILGDDTVVIHNDEGVTEIEITDRIRILETLTALADANADKSAKLEKQKVKLDKHDAEKREIYDELDRVKASNAAEIVADPHMLAVVEVKLAYRRLAEEAANLSPDEKQQFVHQVFEGLAQCRQTLAAAYGSDDWTKLGPKPDREPTGDDEQDYIDALIDRVESGGDNDAELAASM